MVSRHDENAAAGPAGHADPTTLPAAGRSVALISAATLASAVLFFFGAGLSPVGALAWAAPLPVLALAPRVSGLVAFGAGFAAYLLGSASTWPYYLHSNDVPLPAAIPILLGSSVMFGLGALLLGTLCRRGRPLLAAAAPGVLWTGLLYVVSLFSPVGIQYQLAVAVSDQSAVLQLVALTGGWGVEFLVLFVPSAVAVLTVTGLPRARVAAVAGVVVVAALGFGVARLAEAEPDQTRRVATIAGNEPHWGVDVTEPAGRDVLESYVDEIGRLPSEVDTVVLPEGTFGADDASLPDLVEPMSAAADRIGADIMAGVVLRTEGRRYNLTLAIPADGGEPIAYRKWHALPGSPMSTGHELAMLDGIGLMNGFDINHPDPAVDYARAGTLFVVVPAADEDSNGWQHSRQALLRGVEYGFSVASSAQRGTSLLADGYGRPLAQAATTATPGYTVAVATVPDGPGATPYSRIGDWFAWLCLALTLAAGALAVVRRPALVEVR